MSQSSSSLSSQTLKHVLSPFSGMLIFFLLQSTAAGSSESVHWLCAEVWYFSVSCPPHLEDLTGQYLSVGAVTRMDSSDVGSVITSKIIWEEKTRWRWWWFLPVLSSLCSILWRIQVRQHSLLSPVSGDGYQMAVIGFQVEGKGGGAGTFL